MCTVHPNAVSRPSQQGRAHFPPGETEAPGTMDSVPGEECPQVTTYKLLRLSLVPNTSAEVGHQNILSPKPYHATQGPPSRNSTRSTQQSAPRLFFLFPHHPTIPLTEDGNSTLDPVFPSAATSRLLILSQPHANVQKPGYGGKAFSPGMRTVLQPNLSIKGGQILRESRRETHTTENANLPTKDNL